MPIVPTPSDQPPPPTVVDTGKKPNAPAAPAKPIPTWLLVLLAIVCCGAGGAGYWLYRTAPGDSTPTAENTPAQDPASATPETPDQDTDQITPPVPTQPTPTAARPATLSLIQFDQKVQAIGLRWVSAVETARRVTRTQQIYRIRLENESDNSDEKQEQLRIYSSTIDNDLDAIAFDRDAAVDLFLEIVAAWDREPTVFGEQLDMTIETLRAGGREAERAILLDFFTGLEDLPSDQAGRRDAIEEAWEHSYPWPES
ncbi:MAG: hypothetical protein ACIAXF_01515 [Phycisphaerales bacterium JB063]